MWEVLFWSSSRLRGLGLNTESSHNEGSTDVIIYKGYEDLTESRTSLCVACRVRQGYEPMHCCCAKLRIPI